MIWAFSTLKTAIWSIMLSLLYFIHLNFLPLTHTHTHTQLYVSSDPEDYQKEYKDSLMYRYVDFHVNSILLNITIPPGPEATSTTTNVTEGGTLMKTISMNEENKGKERSNIRYLLKELCFIIYMYSIQRYRYKLVQ